MMGGHRNYDRNYLNNNRGYPGQMGQMGGAMGMGGGMGMGMGFHGGKMKKGKFKGKHRGYGGGFGGGKKNKVKYGAAKFKGGKFGKWGK